MTIAIPSNTLLFYQFIASISNFQIIDTRSYLENLLNFDVFNDQPFNNYFDALEYESTNFILALDLMFFIMLMNVALIFITLVLGLINITKCRKIQKYLEEKIFFSVLLRTLIESYLLLCLASATGLYNVRYSNSYLSFSLKMSLMVKH